MCVWMSSCMHEEMGGRIGLTVDETNNWMDGWMSGWMRMVGSYKNKALVG